MASCPHADANEYRYDADPNHYDDKSPVHPRTMACIPSLTSASRAVRFVSRAAKFFSVPFAVSSRVRRSRSFFVRSSIRLSARWSSVARACSLVEACVIFASRAAVRDSKSF